MTWDDPAAREFVDRWGNNPGGTGPNWTSDDDDGLEGGAALAQEFLDAGLAAKP